MMTRTPLFAILFAVLGVAAVPAIASVGAESHSAVVSASARASGHGMVLAQNEEKPGSGGETNSEPSDSDEN